MNSNNIALAVFALFGLAVLFMFSYPRFFNQRSNPATPLANNSTPAKSPIRSLLELIAVIITIIVGILTIYAFYKKL